MLIEASAKLTGAPGTSGWAQVHEFEPQDSEKLRLRGKLFLTVSTKFVENRIDTISSGRELINRLNEEYYGNLSTEPFTALKSAFKKVSDEFLKNWGEVEIAGVAVIGEVMFAVAIGGSGIWISRGGVLASLLSGLHNSVSSASGYPKDGDVILMASKPFFAKVPLGVIKASLSSPTPDDAIETLAPIVHGAEEDGSVCAEIIQFKKPGEVMPITPVSIPQKIIRNPSLTTFLNNTKLIFRKIGKNIPAKEIYIKQALIEDVSPQSKKVSFSIALILLLLLGVSIIFGVRQKKINDLKNQYQGILQESLGEVDQAISLAGVSPERSRELFASAQAKLTQIELMNINDSKLDDLRKKINDGRSAILGEYSINPELFLDLTLLTSGFNGSELVLTGGVVYVMDKIGSRILSADIATKKSAVVAGTGVLVSPTALAGYEDRVFVAQSDGIYEIDGSPKKIIDKTWSGEILMSVFAGNVYIVDKSGNMIYRYQSIGGGFGEKQNWLSPGTSGDFNTAIQTVIDGSVYVMYPNAEIDKYSQGNEQNFILRGLIPEAGNIDSISAGPDNEYIYLLDRAGKRIVVTDKKGDYKAQYVSEQYSFAVNIVADEVLGKIILLTGDKLQYIDMQHL